MEEPYSNRELDAKFANVSQIIVSNHEILMGAIESLDKKVSFTNGRVRWNEKMAYLAIGGIGVLTIMFLPALGWIFLQVIHNNTQISGLIAEIKVTKT